MMKRRFELTEDQGFATLRACVFTLAGAAKIAHVMDPQETEGVEELRSATVEISKGMGMTLPDLENFAAQTTGKPHGEVVNLFRKR